MNKYLEKIAEIEKIALNRLTKHIIENRHAFGKEELEGLYRKGALRSPLQIMRGQKDWDKEQLGKLKIRHERLTGAVKDRFESAYGGGAAAGAYLPARKSIVGNIKGPTRSHETAEAVEYNDSGMRRFAAQRNRRLNRPDLRRKAKELELNDPEIKSMIPESVELMGKHFPGSAPITQGGLLMGMHNNLAVLGRESNFLRTNPYSHVTPMKHPQVPKDFGLTLPKLRGMTGEDRLVGRVTGKRFGVDKMTNKDLRKLRKANPTGPAVDLPVLPEVTVPMPYSHSTG